MHGRGGEVKGREGKGGRKGGEGGREGGKREGGRDGGRGKGRGGYSVELGCVYG